MARDFNTWFSTFRTSIADYTYYVDFDKVVHNVDHIKVELNILDSLIGSPNIEADFKRLAQTYPEVLPCIPILLAVREKEIAATDPDGRFLYNFVQPNLPVEQYAVFMQKTGLFGLLAGHRISNLTDYVTGVETGLDSNARKNRGGHLMERLVEGYVARSGATETYRECATTDIHARWGLDLSALSGAGKAPKRFDFVVKTPSAVYAIETNFYASGGSKLNETARSYKMLAEEARHIHGFVFVWITDGPGWRSARGNLAETFDTLPTLYNINDLEHGSLQQLFGGQSDHLAHN